MKKMRGGNLIVWNYTVHHLDSEFEQRKQEKSLQM